MPRSQCQDTRSDAAVRGIIQGRRIADRLRTADHPPAFEFAGGAMVLKFLILSVLILRRLVPHVFLPGGPGIFFGDKKTRMTRKKKPVREDVSQSGRRTDHSSMDKIRVLLINEGGSMECLALTQVVSQTVRLLSEHNDVPMVASINTTSI